MTDNQWMLVIFAVGVAAIIFEIDAYCVKQILIAKGLLS